MNPHTRRFAEVPATNRPRREKRVQARDPELNTITGVRREPCSECGSRTGQHVLGCPREFAF